MQPADVLIGWVEKTQVHSKLPDSIRQCVLVINLPFSPLIPVPLVGWEADEGRRKLGEGPCYTFNTICTLIHGESSNAYLETG
jgi:hypothetical protein